MAQLKGGILVSYLAVLKYRVPHGSLLAPLLSHTIPFPRVH